MSRRRVPPPPPGSGPTSFRPTSITPVEFFVGELAKDLGLSDGASARRVRRLLFRLVSWTTAEGFPLDRQLIFDPDTIERFVEIALAGDRSRATYRSILRATAPKLTRHAPWEPRPVALARRQLAPPYDEEELDVLFADAAMQPTTLRRRAASALLALGLGAGLDGRWATRVAPGDVERRGGVVFVHVGEPAARSVVVRAEFEEAVLELAATAGTEYLVGGRSTSKNRAGHLSASLKVPTGHPAISASRLRSTWLLAHLEAGTRLPELCRAAGLKGTAVFADLLSLVPPMPNEEMQAMLRGRRR